MRIVYAVLLALRLLAWAVFLPPVVLCGLIIWGLRVLFYRAVLYRSLRRCGLDAQTARELTRAGCALPRRERKCPS